MKKTKILQRDAPELRRVSQPVPLKDIGSKKIKDILHKMKGALHAEQDGVAIAAPQIGENLRIFIINGAIVGLKDIVFINPEIIKVSKKRKKMEEGCLSIRWLYGEVKRGEKVTLKAYDEKGEKIQRGASGLLAQIFQHETDHLNGVLFIDKAENLRDIPPVRFVFFGSLPDGKAGSRFSEYVLEELENLGMSPVLKITSTKDPLPMEKLRRANADVFVVASFGKILPKELLDIPTYQTLNVHPSLLPELRGPAPIQNTILGKGSPGVTIIRMDEEVDHGPIIAQKKIAITPWPDHYAVVEEKLGRAGGKILGELMPQWINGEIPEKPQSHTQRSVTKLIKKKDGLLNLNADPEENLRKMLAYSTWPGAYMFFKNKKGKEVRIVIKDAEIKDLPTGKAGLPAPAGGKFSPLRVIPEGKREMDWQDFLRGN